MRHKIIAYSIKFLLKLILFTCRVKVTGMEAIIPCSKKGPLILILWHNRLAILPEIVLPIMTQARFTAFVSKSRDGEFLSQLCLTYPGASVIRVPHNGRDKALKAMIETLRRQDAILAITPDGPRGPVYQLKPGVYFAAKETNSTCIPFTWTASRFYELKTWDRFRIPLPFSKIEATFGAPIPASDLTSESALQSFLNK